jgi:hypothetical protein
MLIIIIETRIENIKLKVSFLESFIYIPPIIVKEGLKIINIDGPLTI